MFFCRLLILKWLFQKILSGIPLESNSLDPDWAQQNVGPDLSPNCLQKLSADDTSRQSVNNHINITCTIFKGM